MLQLPLSASVTDPGNLNGEGHEKSMGLIKSMSELLPVLNYVIKYYNIGIALVVGLQVCTRGLY